MKLSSLATRIFRRPAARLCALHGDEQGVISILSVVTIFVLAIVLGMVVNAGRQVDDKVRMQNAADAATYSGAVVIARGYNALAFSNHVEAEVFALTAYFRAGRDAGPRKDPTTLNFENSILDAWNKVGSIFAQSSFPKFAAMGQAIQQKVPLEKDVVKYFLETTELQSALVLPVFESILRGPNSAPGGAPDPLGGVIPRFQRSVVLTTPQAAQTMAGEIARMHGNMTSQGKMSGLEKLHRRQPLMAILWRTNAMPISMGNEQDPAERMLPVFDPSPTGPDASASTIEYLELARCQRRNWAQNTLGIWTRYLMDPFWRGIPWRNNFPPYQILPGGGPAAKASALYWIWNIYTCAHLNKLLDVEYYAINVPHVYRVPNNAFVGAGQGCQPQPGVYDCNCLGQAYRSLMYQTIDPLQNSQRPLHLEQYHNFVGVAYWPAMQQTSPTFFRYPLATDAMAFAQASVFIPRSRYIKWSMFSGNIPWLHPTRLDQFGNQLYGNNYDNWPQDWEPLQPVHPINLQWIPVWHIGNQNWMAKLVPATSDSVTMILQSSQAQQFVPNLRTPNLGGMTPIDLRRINTH
ncbi:MAG: Tad domain-containing protein [Planctomycetia bacterium]|nr:Tad domain-containing protein [Planctomycetia bacterium]